jgi:hypothetical protein
MAGESTATYRARLLGHVGGDHALLTELVRMFEADCAVRLAELDDALGAGDLPRGSRLAHRLAGAVGAFLDPHTFDAVRTCERFAGSGDAEAARRAWGSARQDVEALLVALSSVVAEGSRHPHEGDQS